MERSPGWRVLRAAGLVLVQCRALDAVDGLAHAFTARAFGNAGDPFRRVGLDGRRQLTVRQVHGARVIEAGRAADGIPQGDAIVDSHPAAGAPPLVVRSADCLPVLLAAADGRSIAAVHSGWRGTAADVAGAAVSALARGGCDPSTLVAALGPAIGPCCYPVGPEVVSAVARGSGLPAQRIRSGGDRLRLGVAVTAQLERAGVPPSAIHSAPWCTRCSVEPKFHSYRRQGASAGRSLAFIGRVA